MKTDTVRRKKIFKMWKETPGRDWLVEQMSQVLLQGKQALDALTLEVGRMLVETIMYMEREELAGPEYRPVSSELRKWASQPGSVFVGDQKIPVEHPRLRGVQGEIPLGTYKKLQQPGAFSEDLLAKLLRGLSGRRYHETVVEAASAFGVSASSVSRRIVEATAEKLRAFRERDLSDFDSFAIFLDGLHRAGATFVVAVGIDMTGEKRVLGFWEGHTENAEVCEELLADLERRGVVLSQRILWITDGGSGILKTLRNRCGKKLLHQRCTIHKDRNLQRHLPKRFRKEAHRRFKVALEQTGYADAKQMLLELERWLRGINESAADSLREALEEILTVHRLRVPKLLRTTLHTTNPIDSMFSLVRHCEKNIKRSRGSAMAQRWLAAVLLHCEARFKRVKGYRDIPVVVAVIEAELAELEERGKAA